MEIALRYKLKGENKVLETNLDIDTFVDFSTLAIPMFLMRYHGLATNPANPPNLEWVEAYKEPFKKGDKPFDRLELK